MIFSLIGERNKCRLGVELVIPIACFPMRGKGFRAKTIVIYISKSARNAHPQYFPRVERESQK